MILPTLLSYQEEPLPDVPCANEACPNKSREGPFLHVVMEFEQQPRPLNLTLCAPCGRLLKGAMLYGEGGK